MASSFIKDRADTIFKLILYRCRNPKKNENGVIILCTLSHDALYLFEFNKTMFDGFKVIEQKQLKYFITKGHYFAKNWVELQFLFTYYYLMVRYICINYF